MLRPVYQPRTYFVGGINPFKSGISAQPNQADNTMPSPQKPAKRGQKKPHGLDQIETDYRPDISTTPGRSLPASDQASSKASPTGRLQQGDDPVIEAGFIAPTPAQAERERARRLFRAPANFIDLSELTVCNDPLPRKRPQKNKYSEFFSGMKPGQAIKCKPDRVGPVNNALRKWVRDNGVVCSIRSVSDYGDGYGRVWMLPPTRQPKTK